MRAVLVQLSQIAELLRAPGHPDVHLTVNLDRGAIRVGIGGDDFQIVAGQPVLIDFGSSVCREDWFRTAQPDVSVIGGRPQLRRLIKGGLTGTQRISTRNIGLFRSLLPRHPTILMVGAGTMGSGCQMLYDDRKVLQIGFDIYPSRLTQFVADAHQIPLPDASADGVVIQAVLEHVLDPEAVVAEVYRVLRPGGLVYAESPFMQQVHEGAYDFIRFTELGHRWLWREFEEVKRGLVGGPGLSLYWSMRYFFRALLRSHWLGDLASLPFVCCALLDRMLSRVQQVEGANGSYFLGRKGNGPPLAPREIIGSYLGPKIGR